MFARRCLRSIVLGLIVIGLAGCSLFSGEAVEDPPGDGGSTGPPEIEYLVFEDFSQYDPGDRPAGWSFSGLAHGVVEIVADSGLESGRALQVTAQQKQTRNGIFLGLPFSESVREGINTIVIEHKVKLVEGIPAFYVSKGDHRLNWYMTNPRTLTYRYDESKTTPIGVIGEGWHTIRLIANREDNKVDVYLDDMENPVLAGLGFRESIDTWEEARLNFQIYTNADYEGGYLLGDIKVWEFED